MKAFRSWRWFFLVMLVAAGVSACTVTPGLSVGLDVDYYGGKFHVSPAAHVGITGRP
jgi:hypothetical protein